MYHRYSIGEFSKSYRLTEKYRGIKHKKIEIVDEKILLRLSKHKLNLINNIPEGSEYKFLFNNLNKVSINHTKAIKCINENYSGDPDIYNAYKISVDYIQDKTFFFKVDNTAGRVHTNITNLSRELRRFLKFDRKSLINIDISNSQPFLFNKLIQDFFNSNQPFSSFSFYNNTFINNPPYVVQFSDIELYQKLTSEGKFYEFLIEKSGAKIKDRKTFKKEFFGKVFFCKNQDHYTYKEVKLFRKLFPNVHRIILHYKKEDYKQLAINLQRAEAEIMINKVCKRIAEERPEIFVCTIHDSILTTAENKTYICNVILNEFEKNFNLKPSLKIE